MRTRNNWNLKAKYGPQSFVQNELLTKYIDICFIKYKINEIEQKFKQIVCVRDHPAILLSRFHRDIGTMQNVYTIGKEVTIFTIQLYYL